MTRVMPDIAGMSRLQAALAYAQAGMYIVPVAEGTKNPGTVVGDDWPALSTVDARQIRQWWQDNPQYGIALHCGRSGLYVIDIDSPDAVPETWHSMLAGAPSNATRTEETGKGHYFFLMPPDKMLGNGKGKLPKGWGDVRGANGVVILPPSVHPGEMPEADAKDKGGQYRQRRAGEIGPLPDWFKEAASEASPGEYALDDLQVRKFLKENDGNAKPQLLKAVLARFEELIEDGESRHVSSIECLCWAFREARAGLYPAKEAADKIRDLFLAALSQEGNERPLGEGEWLDNVRWAAAQALTCDPAKVLAEVEARDNKKREERDSDGMFRPSFGSVTDHEHAHDVIRWIGDRARYAIDGSIWLMKDGDSWTTRPDLDSGGVVALVADDMPLGQNLSQEEADEATEAQIEAYFEFQTRQRYQDSGRAGKIANRVQKIVSSRKKDDESIVRLADLDKDPFILWGTDGPVDLLPDRPTSDKIDRLAVHLHCTRFHPREVETPCWDAFLEQVWPDVLVRSHALQLLAVGLTGVSEKMFIYMFGSKDKGKSSVPVLLAHALGSYARTDLKADIVSNESLPWDKAALHGTRLAFVDEKPDWRGKSTEELKTMTAGDAEISAAYKGKQPFKFSPTHTLVFASNHEPVLGDPAVRRRLRVVPCTGDTVAIRAARAKLGHLDGPVWQREAPGVLWQMVQYAKKYATNPDLVHEERAPERVKRAEARIHHDQDMFAEWVEEHTTRLPSEEEWLTCKEIYDSFAAWCYKNPRAKYYLNDKTVRSLSMRLHHMSKTNGGIKSRMSHNKTKRWNLNPNPTRRRGY